MEAVIDVRGVEKMYKGRVHALRGVDLQVGSGEIFGLLGPNGAGKSTLVKVLLTVIRATKCEGSLLGAKVGDKSVLRQVGYLPEHHNFPKYLTSRQLLRHFGAMAGVDRSDRNRRAEELLELVGMKDWADSKLGSYSKGMRQRVGIAQALMNDPKLVVLDEPTDGVDPIGRKDIREILTRLKDEGRTVFLNSHLLSELEMVCDRVAIMVHGLMRQQGTIEELTDGQSGYAIRATTAISSDVRSMVQSKLQGVDAIETKDPTELVFATSDAEVVQPVIDTLRSQGVSISAFGFRRPSLEYLFVKAVQEHPQGAMPGARRNKKGDRS
ncbi:MAG: ABC transporter ATP-binding protein [Phycisphaerales bacterium JB052]